MSEHLSIGPLQWALLIFGFAIVVFIFFMSRRDKGVTPDKRGARVITQPRMESPETYGIGGEFDEFGVSTPRKRGDQRPPARVPELNVDPTRSARVSTERRPPAVTPPLPREPVAPPAAQKPVDVPTQTAIPESTLAPAAAVKEKIVTLLVARRDGAALQGQRLHQALAAEGLSYGPMQIYHRKFDGTKRVFSVASLQKPGYLIPEEAAGFTTMGLSVFLLLPGPREATASFEDMLRTSQRLAAHLGADVYDGHKQILNSGAIQALRNEIKAWAGAAGA